MLTIKGQMTTNWRHSSLDCFLWVEARVDTHVCTPLTQHAAQWSLDKCSQA